MLRTLLVTYNAKNIIGHTFVYDAPLLLTKSFIDDLVDALKDQYGLHEKPVIVNIKRLWW
jgi:hypothetical protein